MTKKDLVEVNKVQELNLELISIASFNNFDGEQVVKDLLGHRDLWRGVVIDRADYAQTASVETINLIKLRDIANGYWNVDTLYILPEKGKESELKAITATWGADEVDYESAEWSQRALGGGEEATILRVWWD